MAIMGLTTPMTKRSYASVKNLHTIEPGGLGTGAVGRLVHALQQDVTTVPHDLTRGVYGMLLTM